MLSDFKGIARHELFPFFALGGKRIMSDKIKSYLTGKDIDMEDNIVIINPKQAAFYWDGYGITPVHIYPSKDVKTGDSIVVFVFKRSETQIAYKDWINRR